MLFKHASTNKDLIILLVLCAPGIKANVVVDNGGNVNLNGLVGAAESGGEVRKVLAVVGNGVAEQVEGDLARLAVLLRLSGLEDRGLVHLGADVDDVAAGVEQEVVDPEGADFLAVDEVNEADVALGSRYM